MSYSYVAYDQNDKTFQVWTFPTQEEAVNCGIADARDAGLTDLNTLKSLYEAGTSFEQDGFITSVVPVLTDPTSYTFSVR